MKICSLALGVLPLQPVRRLVFFLVMLGVFHECEIMLADCKCIHDMLKPSRGMSPQRYAQNFRVYAHSQANMTNSTTTSPTPTSASHPRKGKVGYYYRYRKIRYRTTPSVKRPKRFVEEDSNSTVSNSTQPDDSTNRTSSPENQGQYVNSNTSPNGSSNERTKSPNRKVFELYKTKYRNQTNTQTSNSSTTSSTSGTDEVDLSELFKPIRISLFFDDEHIEYRNNSAEYERLANSLERAVKKIEHILSVVPVQGPLLFSRSVEKICNGFWTEPSSPDSQKEKRCGIASPSYDGEQCLDGFKIPDDHLRGYSIHQDRDDPNPTTILYENGTGLPDTDTVIYIRADRTSMCKDKGVIAYATYCQLDQNSRPIAGFANFCPDHLADILYDRDTLFLTALHEFFHALGFSKDLFEKFQDCFPRKIHHDHEEEDEEEDHADKKNATDMEWVCEDRGKTVNFIENRKHIVTPAVTRETRKHLNCSTKQGCPLENHVVLPLKTSSHWEGRFMQGSLMSPTIGLPHLTFIDSITLGAFEDMGWYKVDYSQAEELAWGRNAGCNFSTTQDCHRAESPYFCHQRGVRGCHFLHLDKGICETDQYLDRCLIYKSNGGMECWRPTNTTANQIAWKGEVYSQESRCFLANLKSDRSRYKVLRRQNQLEGRCYLHRCNDSETLEVQVDGSEWQTCPEGALIEIDGYEGVLKCPPASLLCGFDFSTTSTAPAIGSTSRPKEDEPYCASIRISFPTLATLRAQMKNSEKDPELAEEAEMKLDMFLMKFTNEIVAVTDIDETRIMDIHFTNDQTVQFVLMKNIDWTTYTPKDPDSSLSPGDYDESKDPNDEENYPVRYKYMEVSCEEAVRRLLKSVQDGNFKVPVDGQVYKAGSINYTSSEETVESLRGMLVTPEKQSQTGTTAAATVGAICGIMLLAVGALLYWKSHVTTAVSPAPPSPTSTDVRYHPNHGSTAPPSENGSMGQLTFMA